MSAPRLLGWHEGDLAMEGIFNLLFNTVPSSGLVVAVGVIFVRFSLFFFLLPGLGEVAVPVRVRLLVALVVTWLVAPVILTFEPFHEILYDDLMPSRVGALFLLESLVGFIMGFGFRGAIFVLQIAGTIIAQALSLSQIFGSTLTEEPNTMISTMLIMTGTTLALTMGLHVEVLRVLIGSYDVFPVSVTSLGAGVFMGTENIARWALDMCTGVVGFALSLSLPFVLLNFLYNLMLGLINRAMPQLMVSFVGLPAITGVGLLLLAISAGVVLLSWVSVFETVVADFSGGY